jgi:Homeodomain-like domain
VQKKYIVRLSDAERQILEMLIRRPRGSSSKIRRAQVLLKCDADGPNWTDQRIAEAFDCQTKTVENIRQRLVIEGFATTLEARKPVTPPRAKLLDGEQEAKIIALRLGKPPKGFANWTLRLLADTVVELGIAPSVSHETVRKTLKKTG